MSLVLATTEAVEGRSLPTLLYELCLELGAELYIEPQYGYAGYVEFPSGQRSFFKGTSFDVNPQGACAIAKDKDYCAGMLNAFHYTVPEGVLLFSPRYQSKMHLRNEKIAAHLGFAQRAIEFSDNHKFPLYLKPNEGSEGRGVTKVNDIDGLFSSLWSLFEQEEKVLLQTPVEGRDFRIVVLDGNDFHSASSEMGAHRPPLCLTSLYKDCAAKSGGRRSIAMIRACSLSFGFKTSLTSPSLKAIAPSGFSPTQIYRLGGSELISLIASVNIIATSP